MRGKGRPLGYQHDERTRKKIKTTQVINRLQDHVFGKVEMSATQVRAAEALLRKTLPDLSQVEYRHEGDQRFVVDTKPMSKEEWNKAFVPSGDHSQDHSTH